MVSLAVWQGVQGASDGAGTTWALAATGATNCPANTRAGSTVMHEVTGYYYSIFDMSKGFIWGVKCVLAISPYKANSVAFASLVMTSYLIVCLPTEALYCSVIPRSALRICSL